MNHYWGDKDFDWKALYEAEQYLNSNCRRWARLGIWTKEKYGTLRVSATCAYFTQYSFIEHFFYPGYVRYMFPKWFRVYIDYPLGKMMNILGILDIIQRYQTWVLKYFWKRAAKKWPQVAAEILDEYKWMMEDIQ